MNQPITFQRCKEEGIKITIIAVGDIMMQKETQLSAQTAMELEILDYQDRISSGFQSIFKPVISDLTQGDLLIGNLETPIAANLIPQHTITTDNKYICDTKEIPKEILYDGEVYGETKYPHRRFQIDLPNFNTHPSLALALKDIGFDILSTANNHTLDRGHNGIDRSIEALNAIGLDFVGTTHSEDILSEKSDEFAPKCHFVI